MKRLLSISVAFTFLAPFGAAAATYQDPLENQRATSSTQINEKQLTCLLDAVDKRERAVRKALDDFYAYTSKTLEGRRELLNKAWRLPNGNNRRVALKAIWRKFGFTWRDSTNQMREKIRAAWTQYRSDRSDCKVVGYDEETGGMGMDSQF